MGAPPNEEQMADMLSNPMIAQTMNEALNNPNFVDYMIRSNPTLASMPNAREMLQSPAFRDMMTNPEAIRMAARMRRAFQGGGGSDFPAPGATDNTPAGAPQTGGFAADGNNINDNLLRNLFGAPGGLGGPPGSGAANPFASIFGGMVPPGGVPGAAGAAGASSENRDAPAGTANTPGQAGGGAQPANPFAALFGGLGQGGAPGAPGAPGANAGNPFGLPPISPEAMQQIAQMWGLGSPGAAPAAPADTRPPEERYAEQLRQLNDMGFYDFDRNVAALRRSGGSVQGAIEHLLSS
jgi:ubiquilin